MTRFVPGTHLTLDAVTQISTLSIAMEEDSLEVYVSNSVTGMRHHASKYGLKQLPRLSSDLHMCSSAAPLLPIITVDELH